jgi:hypothetical protein
MTRGRVGSMGWITVVLVAVCGCTASSQGARHTGTVSAVSDRPATSVSGGSHVSRGNAAPVSRRAAHDVPRFKHIVVVVEENHSYSQVAFSRQAPYLTSLAAAGVRMTNSYAVTHPSQPNYLALFTGSTFGINNDSCPHHLSGPTLASDLRAVGDSFAGYSESLPRAGFAGCDSGLYARKHAPWVNFGLPAAVNQPFSAFPHDFARLPTVAFVIPNLDHDMHNGSVRQADRWLSTNLSSFADWSVRHDSLLIVTFDEGADGSTNRILTVLYGADLMPGTDGTRVTHYSVLRTIEDAYQLRPIGKSASAVPITADWQS